MEVPPLTILASLTIRETLRYFQKATFKQRNWVLLAVFILLLSIVPSVLSYRKLITISPWDTMVEVGPRRLHAYIDDVLVTKTPPDSAIIFGVLAPIHLSGKTVIYADNFLNDDRVIDFVTRYLQSGKSVLMFETHTCDLYPDKCKKVVNRFTFETYQPAIDSNYPGFEVKKILLKKS
jgi:hypothetical protein